MDDHPKEHDFDQRHDGPFGRPSVDATSPTAAPHRPSIHLDPIRHASAPAVPEKSGESQPFSTSTSPTADKTRKSVQILRHDSDRSIPPRRSTNVPRPSRDFDNRRDGPYGRPSLTMQRRRSSGFLQGGDLTHTQSGGQAEEPTAPDLADLEAFGSETRPSFEPEPPPLNYSLYDRKWFILFFWTMILVDCIAAPIILYFCLWYLTDLSPNATFSIVTAALGGVSIFEYFVRFWRLWKKGSTCRVIGARRMYLDWFHWNFTLGWVVVMIELIVGTVPENPPIRLVAMPLASMLFAFGTEMIVVDTLRYFQVPAPVRISSIPKGAQLRPAIYSMIEDVVAVDGSGGTEYREALNRRYEASHMFRAMLRRLGLFWAVGANGMAVVTTILIFTIHPEAAYVVGWSAPFVWAGIWTAITMVWVHHSLKAERKAWAEELAEKQEALSGATGPVPNGHDSDHGALESDRGPPDSEPVAAASQ